MISINLSDEVAIRVRRILDDRNCSGEIARIAGEVLDLTVLLETWPVPRSSNLDEDWRRKVSELCRLFGGNLCGAQQCTAHQDIESDLLCGISRTTNQDESHP